MLDKPKHEDVYQRYMDEVRKNYHHQRHEYWKARATELNAENIELKLARMDDARRTKLHAIWVTVGAAMLLIALFLHG
jgi:hypothetical protein